MGSGSQRTSETKEGSNLNNWVIQSNIGNDTQGASMAHAVKSDGGVVFSAELIPFSDEIKFWDEPDTDDLIPYGSTKLIQLAIQRGWKGVFMNDNFNVRTWNENHPKMLNKDAFHTTVGNLQAALADTNQDDTMFIRPLHDLKAFAGTVASISDIRNWKTGTVFGNFQVPDETDVILSSHKEIIGEHRWFIVGGKVIEGRRYRQDGKLVSFETGNVWKGFAQDLADCWLPHETCVMDTAVINRGVYVVEFNCLNCSGFYGHDPAKIVKAIHNL